MLEQFLDNFLHNLFKPLLLFFYLGFLVPLLRVPFEFPYAIYKGLIIYLLISIGWHGGEELAALSAGDFGRASGFMALGFVTNLLIGIAAYWVLRFTNIRQIDAAAVAGYYGSDSAGTFVTCLGVLTASNIAFAAYMPVMLAVMEIPGCLVALALVPACAQVARWIHWAICLVSPITILTELVSLTRAVKSTSSIHSMRTRATLTWHRTTGSRRSRQKNEPTPPVS